MTIQIQARFEDGVFVPSTNVDLPNHEEVTLTIDASSRPVAAAAALSLLTDPNDPMPEGGVALIDWWARHRIQLDPAITHKIIHSKAYTYYEEPDDEEPG